MSAAAHTASLCDITMMVLLALKLKFEAGANTEQDKKISIARE
jgi:hypothetical protein